MASYNGILICKYVLAPYVWIYIYLRSDDDDIAIVNRITKHSGEQLEQQQYKYKENWEGEGYRV